MSDSVMAEVSNATTRPPAARRAGVIMLLAATVTLPFFVSGYVLLLFTMVIVYAIAILGLNILTGYSGQISLGQGAFFGVGAYAAGSLMTVLGVPYGVAILCAGLLCGLIGYLISFPANRLTGPYLALVTFGIALALPQLLKYQGLEGLTGGVQGLSIAKPAAPFGLPLSDDQWIYAHALLWLLALFVFAHNLMSSQIGLSIIALRDQPLAAAAMGVELRRLKSSIFALSSFFAGIGGALSTIATQFVAPDGFTALLSINLLVGLVVGGVGTSYGPLIGAAFIVFVPNLTDQISKGAAGALFAVVLLLIVFIAPGGIAGLLGHRSKPPR